MTCPTFQEDQSSENDDLLPKPWLNSKGKLLTTNELREVSKGWDPITWENFLASTVDKQTSDHEIQHPTYLDLLNDETETVWNDPFPLPELVHRQIHLSVARLKPVPRGVIRGVFFHEFSQAKVGRVLKISQQAVSRAKKLSLRKIRALLESEVVVAAYLIRGSADLSPRRKTRNEEIREVYRNELNGSVLK